MNEDSQEKYIFCLKLATTNISMLVSVTAAWLRVITSTR